MEKWNFIIGIGISIAHLGMGTWFIIICNIYSIFCNFVKQCNVSNSEEQKYIIQMSAIDVYV